MTLRPLRALRTLNSSLQVIPPASMKPTPGHSPGSSTSMSTLTMVGVSPICSLTLLAASTGPMSTNMSRSMVVQPCCLSSTSTSSPMTEPRQPTWKALVMSRQPSSIALLSAVPCLHSKDKTVRTEDWPVATHVSLPPWYSSTVSK